MIASENALHQSVRPFESPSLVRSAAQLVGNLACFVGCWGCAWASLDVSYALTLLFCVPT